jgi:Transposase DDE domain
MTNAIPDKALCFAAGEGIQTLIRLPLPIVRGNKDYDKREELLLRMDELLQVSGVEDKFLTSQVALVYANSDPSLAAKALSSLRLASIHRHAKQSLRCTVARILSNESHRDFSVHLAESPLLQWFCGIDLDGVIQVPSKSSLQRMEAAVGVERIQELNALLLKSASPMEPGSHSPLGLEEPVDLTVVWMDSTCAKLDIHYPVDWLLLRDAIRTLIKSIITIRRHGLKGRMPTPETFIASINVQAMAMSASSRRGQGGDKKKARKKILRTMKRQVKTVRQHAQRYRALLEESWDKTDLTPPQAQRIIDRINNVLTQLPAALKQAHERIIGERTVANKGKILSLSQPHAQVYVRGKSGSDVEFGLQLLISESAEGLIIDSHLSDKITNDSQLLMPTISRMRKNFGNNTASTIVTDRGFTSSANNKALAKANITNGTLPRNPDDLAKALQDPTMRRLHRRRAQTEARIGIFKGQFIGDHLPTKNYDNQKRYVAWATLAHNLWVLARLKKATALLATG